MAWSFKPLKITLIKKEMKMSDLPLNPKTKARINKNQSITIETLDKIANFLEVSSYSEIIEKRRE